MYNIIFSNLFQSAVQSLGCFGTKGKFWSVKTVETCRSNVDVWEILKVRYWTVCNYFIIVNNFILLDHLSDWELTTIVVDYGRKCLHFDLNPLTMDRSYNTCIHYFDTRKWNFKRRNMKFCDLELDRLSCLTIH